MHVNVRLLPPYSGIAGTSELTLPLDEGTTVGQALSQLASRFGREFETMVLAAPHKGQPSLELLLNGRSPFLGQGLDTPLHQGDAITLLLLVTGG